MNKMNIKHIIATMNNSEDINEFIEKRNIKTGAVITNQGYKEGKINYGNYLWIDSKQRGLSNSRNESLDNVKDCDVVMIADDDIVYKDDYIDTVNEAYKKYPDADIITFLITVAGGKSDRIDSKKPIKHNKKTILSIGSNEVTFKLKSINDSGLRFDNRFGLGSGKFISGEENVFLNEAMKKRLKMYHYPVVIADHPINDLSNGHWNEKMIYTKGAFFRNYSGVFAYMFAILFWLLKQKNIDNNIGFVRYIKLWRRGMIDEYNSRRYRNEKEN